MRILRLAILTLASAALLTACVERTHYALVRVLDAATAPSFPKFSKMTVEEMFPHKPQVQALALAAEQGDIAEIDRLVADGVSPNSIGAHGITVPGWLLYHPNKDGFRRLLELGADPNKKWNSDKAFYSSLMHCAAGRASTIGPDYMRMVVEIGKGNLYMKAGNLKETPVQMASMHYSDREILTTLIDVGLDVNFTTSYGVPLIALAISSSNYEGVLYLLEHGATYKTESKSRSKNIIVRIQDDISKNHSSDPDMEHYMWFWRCVDFLEKRGETFTFTFGTWRPAELSTTPPFADLLPPAPRNG